MINLSNYITQQINESVDKNPLLKYEVKTNGSFEPGDVVLFREFYEKGDDSIIMIVAEDRGNRSLVSEIGTSLVQGSKKTISNRNLFKVGQVTINLDDKKHPVIPAASIAEAIKLCEDLGMDCEEIKKKEHSRVGKW
jgi:hypothetical protein